MGDYNQMAADAQFFLSDMGRQSLYTEDRKISQRSSRPRRLLRQNPSAAGARSRITPKEGLCAYSLLCCPVAVMLTASLSFGQQPTLAPQARFALAGELIALASCERNTQLVALTRVAGAANLQIFHTLTRQPVGAPVSVPSADPKALALNADCKTAFIADATANSVLITDLPSGACACYCESGPAPQRPGARLA
jgi:hypothetical protein